MKNTAVIGATNSIGSIPVPAWESSHHGCVALSPQLHQRYLVPSSTRTS
jgi:hypothetical protein